VKSWVARILVVGLLAVGAGVGLTMVLVGDDGGGTDRTERAGMKPEAGSRTPPSAALARFYGQQLDWSECGRNNCATLTVPLDYSEPQGKTIELALLRRPANDPDARTGSLVVNPGGPGAPGTDYAAGGTSSFGGALTERLDIVGFDPRGTGESSPVSCLSAEELDDYIAMDQDPDTKVEARVYSAALRSFGRGCAAESGDVASHVSTVEAARDLDVLRAALGDAKLDYFGASYGTKLGATYAELYPDKVGHLVLDGAIDLSLSARELALQQAEGFQVALEAYVDNCVETGKPCFLGDSVDAGVDRVEQLLDEIDGSPLPAGGGRELRIGNAVYGVITPLYNRDYWPLLTRGLQQAIDGDGAGLMLLADAYTSRGPDGYLNNTIEANLAINCLDDPTSIPPSKVPTEYPAFTKVSSTFGRFAAWSLTNCFRYPSRVGEAAPTIRAEGADPIVVIGTSRDPATPLIWAEALVSQLASGVLIRRDGDGHTGFNAGNDCVDEAVEDFLLDGLVPEDDLDC
jgi:pimeloyl-ACP methyl ester carboxylesterase